MHYDKKREIKGIRVCACVCESERERVCINTLHLFTDNIIVYVEHLQDQYDEKGTN